LEQTLPSSPQNWFTAKPTKGTKPPKPQVKGTQCRHSNAGSKFIRLQVAPAQADPLTDEQDRPDEGGNCDGDMDSSR